MNGNPEEMVGWAELPEHEERRYLRALLQELAQPRLCGSSGASLADRVLRQRLKEFGYEVRELPFSFSAWPARFLVPLVGGSYLAALLIAAALLRQNRRAGAAAILLATPPLLGGVAGCASALVALLPWGRIQTSNWLVYPPDSLPRYLVMAHRDSKSQPVSTAVRTLSAVMAPLAWAGLLGLALFRPRRAPWRRHLAHWSATALGTLAGGILLRCGVGNESPGALDNASGLAALLGIARRERGRGDVAFLLTDGEELWLAGARNAARNLPEHEGIINLDGLDDDGSFHLIERRRRPRHAKVELLSAAIVETAAKLGHPVVRRDLPLGILVDHIPLARAGHPAITIMHGSRRSLRRVHRPTDHVDRMTGEGVHRTVLLICHMLQRVRQQSLATG